MELAVVLFTEGSDVIPHRLNMLLESVSLYLRILVFRHPLLIGHQ